MFLVYICMLIYMYVCAYIYTHICIYIQVCICVYSCCFFFYRIFTLQNCRRWAGNLYKGVLSHGRQQRSADKLEPKGTDKSMSMLVASDFNGVAVLWDEVVPSITKPSQEVERTKEDTEKEE